MRRTLYLLVSGAAAACAVSNASPPGSGPTSAPNTATAAVAAADPWGSTSNQRVTVDPKDPDLAQLAELATSGPGLTQYPQADAVIALQRDDITLATDRHVTRHHKSIVKLLDAQRGKEKFADIHIPYDTKRQQLTIITARTVNADGVPHAAAGSEISDIVPERLADATIYSDVRERVISFPAVDKGSVVELEYMLTSKASPEATLGGEQLLATWDPVLDRTVTITAPTGVTPKLSVQGLDLVATESRSADHHTWTYHLANEPDRHPEMEQPRDEIVLPRVLYSFQPSWHDLAAPLAARFLGAALPSPLPATIKTQADTLVAGAPDETTKAQRLFAFVAHDVQTIDVPLAWAGYTPNAPDVVLAHRYANNRDKAALLVALCAAEGLTAQPVLVRTGKVPVIASVPTVAQFDHFLVKLAIGGADVWLDPSDEHGQYNVAFAGQDNLVLPIVSGGAELGMRAALAASSSVSHTSARFVLAGNGDLDAAYTYELTGWFADRADAELRAKQGEHLDQFFSEEATNVAASGLDKGHTVGDRMAVAGPLVIAQHVFVPGYSAAQSGFRVLELPAVSLAISEDMPGVGTSTRAAPLWLGTPRTQIKDVTLQIPAGWRVSYVPPKLEGNVDGAKFSAACDTNAHTVSCHTKVELDKMILAPEQYPALHDALANLAAYERRVVVLVRS